MRVLGPVGEHADVCWPIQAISVGAGVGIAIADFFTANINLSILYLLPLLLTSRLGRPSSTWRFAAGAVLLTYAGYLLGPPPEAYMHVWSQRLFDYRMLNRTFAATAIVMIAAIVHFWLSVNQRLLVLDAARDPNPDDIAGVLMVFRQACAAVACVVTSLAVMAIDAMTPAEYNLPILYTIPIVACAWLRSRQMLWIATPVLLLATFAGYLYTTPAGAQEIELFWWARNRIIAGIVIVLAACVVDGWVRIGNGSQRTPGAQQDLEVGDGPADDPGRKDAIHRASGE